MDALRPNKRRRLVASCTECHRRKQKCDRQKPCSTCITRNVPTKCSYAESSTFEHVVFSNTEEQGPPVYPYSDQYYSTEQLQTIQFQPELLSPEAQIPKGQFTQTFQSIPIDPELFSAEDVIHQRHTSQASRPNEENIPLDTNEDDLIDPLLRDSNPASFCGYSVTNGNNALVAFKQLLHDEKSFQAVTTPIPYPQSKDTADKFWQLSAGLPSMAVVERLVDLFFMDVNWQYSFVERYYFDELLRQWKDHVEAGESPPALRFLSLDLQYFPALLFQVLSIALQFIPEDVQFPELLQAKDKSSYDNISRRYSETGMHITDMLGRTRTCLVAVQHDIFRACWLKNTGRITEAWHALGTSIRQAQELGLHRQSSIQQHGAYQVEHTLGLLWYDEYKRRLWINLFIWDSQMAMILGRPRTINANDCNIKPPMDCDIPTNPSKSVLIPVQPDNRPSAFSERLVQYSLAQKIHEMRTLGADQRHLKEYSVVQTLHAQVLALLDTAPASLRPSNPDVSWDLQCKFLPAQREQLLSTVNMYLMALHKPHLVTHFESRQAAWNAASAVLESQQRLFQISSPRFYKNFTLSFYTADAAILASAMGIRFPPQDEACRKSIIRNLDEAVTRLETMKTKNPIAASGLSIVLRCCNKARYFYGLKASGSMGIISTTPPSLDQQAELTQTSALEIGGQIDSSRGLPSTPDDSLQWSGIDVTDFDPAYWIQQFNQTDMEIFGTSTEPPV